MKLKDITLMSSVLCILLGLTIGLVLASASALQVSCIPKTIARYGSTKITVSNVRIGGGTTDTYEVLQNNLQVTKPNGDVALYPNAFILKFGGSMSVTFPSDFVSGDTNQLGVYNVTVRYNLTGDGTALGNFTVVENIGGVQIAIDKFGLLAPYIGLASTTMIGAVATAVCVRRVKRKKEKE